LILIGSGQRPSTRRLPAILSFKTNLKFQKTELDHFAHGCRFGENSMRHKRFTRLEYSTTTASILFGSLLVAILLYASSAAQQPHPFVEPPADLIPRAPANPMLPSIFIISDSTADYHLDRDHEGAAAIQGWGDFFPAFFDPTKVNVVNAARGGRSTRTYMTEGLWNTVLAQMKPNDVVLLQLGQNDIFELNDRIARGTIPGIGDESQEIDNQVTHKHETVHTFGWYLRKYIQDTRAKGAIPIVMSLTTRNVWKDGHVEVGVSGYREWSRTIAEQEHRTDFVDVSTIIAREYEKLGQTKVAGLFHTREPVHMTTPGAFLAAQCTVAGLKALLDAPVSQFLSNLGQQVSSATELSFKWPANPKLPTLWIIGDSTVRNGDGEGTDGLWGWGDEIAPSFDSTRLNVVNRAVGGRSSRTYYTMHWPLLLPSIQSGDFVIMQFGHNDSGAPDDKSRARAVLPGIGDETREILNPITGMHEVVHTYGWYLRQFIAETRQKGATPLLCSLVPRKVWVDGMIKREDYARWAAEAAHAEKVPFLDLNQIIANQYEQLGTEKVETFFGDPNTHTTLEGAKKNAQAVIQALKALQPDPLSEYLSSSASQPQP
jgi:lysophospholipase L1-like esterase